MNELYELPDGWEWKTFGELFKITSSKRVHKKDWLSRGIPFYRAREIVKLSKNGFVDNELFISEEMYSSFLEKYGVPKKDDILVTGVGTLGICYVVKENDKFYFKDGNIIWFKNKNNINSRFIEYSFQSEFLKNQINSNSGSTVATYTITNANNTQLPLPPIVEQQKIVSKLDNLFKKIDKSIALHQKNMDEADVFMGSVLHDVFGELEEKYGLIVLSTVVKINSGIALPKIFKNVEFSDGELEFFKVAQMNNDNRVMKGANLNFTLSQSKELKIKLFPKGSILIPKRGGAILTNKKRIMEKEASYDSNIMGLKADNKILSDEFLFKFLNSIDLSNYIDTTTIPQVNNKHIDMMNISIPPLDIQQKIVKYLDEVSKKIEKLKSVQKEKMKSLVALKASILDRAFRGKL